MCYLSQLTSHHFGEKEPKIDNFPTHTVNPFTALFHSPCPHPYCSVTHCMLKVHVIDYGIHMPVTKEWVRKGKRREEEDKAYVLGTKYLLVSREC